MGLNDAMPSSASGAHVCGAGTSLCAVSALLALAITGSARAGGNPGYDRPGLGFAPAVLQAGDMTWEQGLPDWSRAGAASLYTADALLRVGMGGPLEMQLGTSYNRLSASGEAANGRGDSSLGLKFALPGSGPISWGLLGNVTFTDGAREFRGEDRQYLLSGVFNWQLNSQDAVGTYLEVARSGGRNDYLAAFNAGRSLTATLVAYVEIAWSHAAGTGNGRMAGAGLAWQLTPRVQLDGSFRHRLGGAADTWEAGFGVSTYFGRS